MSNLIFFSKHDRIFSSPFRRMTETEPICTVDQFLTKLVVTMQQQIACVVQKTITDEAIINQQAAVLVH